MDQAANTTALEEQIGGRNVIKERGWIPYLAQNIAANPC